MLEKSPHFYLHLPTQPPPAEQKRAIFLDRDGVLIKNVPYLNDPEGVELLPNVVEGLQLLQQHYLLVVATNQSGIARGYLDEGILLEIHKRLYQQLGERGVYLHALFYCPHLPHGSVPAYSVCCDCRKPKAGLLLQAAQLFGLDLPSCWMIGDQVRDIQAGQNAQTRAILITPRPPSSFQGLWAFHLKAAAERILSDSL
ncbi:MAG: HAD family hydrolase [Planctomycetota bacterium]|nr:MAG: HAD family hydrolase [Planctomycetota bacterium]